MKRFIFICILWLAAALGSPPSALAIVDMNSASYSNMWTDIQFKEPGFNFQFVRAYKSRTLYVGLFGFGWCSMAETRLYYLNENAIVLSICGDGEEEVFVRDTRNPDANPSLQSRVGRVLPGLERMGYTPEALASAEAELSVLPGGLGSYADVLGADAKPLPAGVFRSSTSGARLSVTATGVTLVGSSQGTHVFDRAGRLVRYTGPQGETVDVARLGVSGIRLTTGGHLIDLMFGAADRYVREVRVDGVTRATYTYSEPAKQDGARMLVSMINQWGNVYRYKYNEYRNLTRADWPDGTGVEIEYDDEKDWVTAFSDRDGCRETYGYYFGADMPREFAVETAAIAAISSPIQKTIATLPEDKKFKYASTVIKTCGDKVVARNIFAFRHAEVDTPIGKDVRLLLVSSSLNGRVTVTGYADRDGELLKITSPLGVLWRESDVGASGDDGWAAIGEWGTFRKSMSSGCPMPRRFDGVLTLGGRPMRAAVEVKPGPDSQPCSIDRVDVTLDGGVSSFSGLQSGMIKGNDLDGALDIASPDFAARCHLASGNELAASVKRALTGAAEKSACGPAERAAILLGAVYSWGWLGRPQ